MDIQPQPSSSTLQSVLYALAVSFVAVVTLLLKALVDRKGRASSVARDGAETRLADASARHTEAESQQLAWERIDVLHKIIESKDAELLRLRGRDAEIEMLTMWNKRMRATLTSNSIPIPDQWVSGENKRA